MSKVSARRPFFKNAALDARSPFKKKCPDLVCGNHFSALDIAISMIQQHIECKARVFYYLVLERFLNMPRVGGGNINKNKMTKTRMLRPLQLYIIMYFLCHFYEKEDMI